MNLVIVPTLNNLRLTQQAVKSFLAQDIGRVHVLIIDNGSTDGTIHWAGSSANGRTSLIINPKQSVASAWNIGLEIAFEIRTMDYALVCNNDVVLRPDTYRVLKEQGLSFVSGIGRSDNTCLEGGLPHSGILLPGSWRPHPDFSCFLIRRPVWEKVGPFDEKYTPGFFEDNDYHVRMHRMGIRAGCVDLPFHHVGAGSQTIKHMSASDRRKLQEAADRNRERFRVKYGCLPGTAEYDELFTEESFGISADPQAVVPGEASSGTEPETSTA